ncbi:hypothetical protein [Bifidobacterium tsurumiense]|uniref:hypothetical protein n=1 Tax=Bifidobacterium tsurumiense TaxID=356829 RepID=UPI0012B2BD8A|nr:hypothetical protein [Bifidobacterium tsurumiense]MSS12968.1 hypothetical protein [Bifidobacterium tsurumiense]
MTATVRSARSHAAPAGREHEMAAPAARPQLRVVEGGRVSGGIVGGFHKAITWTKTRSTPLLHVVFAVVFLIAVLLGSLALRTQMVQNSFEASQVQSNISKLTQDVDDDQAKLDALEASLPEKAQSMGMIPQQGSISIDLSGYKATGGQSQ